MTTKHIFTVLFLIIGFIGGKFAYDALFGQSDTANYEETDWTKSYCLGVAYEAPFELSLMDLQIPQNVKRYVKEMENYQFESMPITFYISRAEYQVGITPNIDGAVNGSVQSMQVQKGITDFTHNVSTIDKNSMEGRLVKGTCKINGKDAEFIAYTYLKNMKLLQIMIMNLNLPENREVKDRIIKSMRISL
ncbi:MAG: hypothetical protein EHM64_13675 [Ignavibacteriae bacterium]|nr:MAG: hypothetical protein EHM64_13675 [Ignavibacteriota bacterium]